jgi:hypothetical protein
VNCVQLVNLRLREDYVSIVMQEKVPFKEDNVKIVHWDGIHQQENCANHVQVEQVPHQDQQVVQIVVLDLVRMEAMIVFHVMLANILKKEDCVLIVQKIPHLHRDPLVVYLVLMVSFQKLEEYVKIAKQATILFDRLLLGVIHVRLGNRLQQDLIR